MSAGLGQEGLAINVVKIGRLGVTGFAVLRPHRQVFGVGFTPKSCTMLAVFGQLAADQRLCISANQGLCQQGIFLARSFPSGRFFLKGFSDW